MTAPGMPEDLRAALDAHHAELDRLAAEGRSPWWEPAPRPDLDIENGGLQYAHTERCYPARIGHIQVTITNRGSTLYRPLCLAYTLLDEAGQALGPTGATVRAPLPGERLEYRVPVVLDAARRYRFDGWEQAPP